MHPKHAIGISDPALWGARSVFSVFLAEDDGDHIMLLERALSRYRQPVKLTVARDGQRALELLAESDPPDMMLLDINMPRRTGFEVLTTVRADARLAGVPVVMLTTSTRDEDRRMSLEKGADAFVTKPTSFKAFTDALFVVLDAHLGADG